MYRIAGCGNQPAQAFEFIDEDLQDYKVIDVNYRPDRGCDMKLIAVQITNDIAEHNYERALIIGCSIGDYVSRWCEGLVLGHRVYSIAINPEPDVSLLKPWAKVATRVGVPIATVLQFITGWGSQWQGYSDCGNRFSLHFMISQFREIGFRMDAPDGDNEYQLGIILAEPDANGKGEDEFLLGRDAMQEYFGKDVEVYSAIGAGHGNTVKGAAAYKAAWDQLWPGAKARLEAVFYS